MLQADSLSSLAPKYDNLTQSGQPLAINDTSKQIINSQYPPEKLNNISNEEKFVIKEDCPKKECDKECDKGCVKPCCNKVITGYTWSWVGALILWFIIFTVLFWLIFYSLKPSFVLQNDSNQIDTSKVLLSALIAALILVIIIWLIKLAVGK
jgi:hypothetical protein